VRDFGTVFLMLNYTDITQNTYIQSWTVTEIMAIEMYGLLGCRRTVRRPWRHTCPIRTPAQDMVMQSAYGSSDVTRQQISRGLRKVLGSLRTTMTRLRVFLWFNLMALCNSQVSLMLRTAINITETTYFCQFQYEFGNQ